MGNAARERSMDRVPKGSEGMRICDHGPITRFLKDGSKRCVCACADDTIQSLERQLGEANIEAVAARETILDLEEQRYLLLSVVESSKDVYSKTTGESVELFHKFEAYRDLVLAKIAAFTEGK